MDKTSVGRQWITDQTCTHALPDPEHGGEWYCSLYIAHEGDHEARGMDGELFAVWPRKARIIRAQRYE